MEPIHVLLLVLLFVSSHGAKKQKKLEIITEVNLLHEKKICGIPGAS